jgi:hypothetical protein
MPASLLAGVCAVAGCRWSARVETSHHVERGVQLVRSRVARQLWEARHHLRQQVLAAQPDVRVKLSTKTKRRGTDVFQSNGCAMGGDCL